MDLHHEIRRHLLDIEQTMRALSIWQSQPPARTAFESVEPFCIDTMQAQEWLQWILLPRMHALLDKRAPLPTRFSISPYFEEALPDAEPLLIRLRRLDSLLNQDPTLHQVITRHD
ncbi:YqcC family protein [Acerihabitans sp. KWT182]|uniref:YqcC family protein n=1 Tax=Acerihabitans sp. KWT182 TaxID=3157919 RepID=A0AAU7Q7G2_9GAMM